MKHIQTRYNQAVREVERNMALFCFYTCFPNALRFILTLLDWLFSCTVVHMAMSALFTHTFLNNLPSFGPKFFKCALTCEIKMRMILSPLPRICSFPDRILPHHLPRAPSYSLLPAGCLNTICSWEKLPLTT